MSEKNLPDFIVLYDDDCGLCHSFVQFLLKIDTHKRVYYTPLTGKTGQQLLKMHNEEGDYSCIDSVFASKKTETGRRLYYYSNAALQTFKQIGYPWKAFWWLSIVPRFIRDSIYKILAKNRYSIFGKREEKLANQAEDSSQILN